MIRSAAFQSAGPHLANHPQRSNAHRATGHGARSIAAAYPTSPRRIRSLLSATTTGTGPLITSAARSRRFLHLTRPDARRTSSGEYLFSEIYMTGCLFLCRYGKKNCCLSIGGPTAIPTPPHDRQCPSRGWTWSRQHKSCIPHHHHPHTAPAPQCGKFWQWSHETSWCQKSFHHQSPSDCKKGEFWYVLCFPRRQ